MINCHWRKAPAALQFTEYEQGRSAAGTALPHFIGCDTFKVNTSLNTI